MQVAFLRLDGELTWASLLADQATLYGCDATGHIHARKITNRS
jgi:hypothetical protein